jgi:hypothetical protein
MAHKSPQAITVPHELVVVVVVGLNFNPTQPKPKRQAEDRKEALLRPVYTVQNVLRFFRAERERVPRIRS